MLVNKQKVGPMKQTTFWRYSWQKIEF